MKNSLITLTFILLSGCSQNDSLAFMMEASFTEQFSYACEENTKCIEATELYMESCFNKELAISAIEADKADKKQINTMHILDVQECLSKESGNDYWKKINMPEFILSQVN